MQFLNAKCQGATVKEIEIPDGKLTPGLYHFEVQAWHRNFPNVRATASHLLDIRDKKEVVTSVSLSALPTLFSRESLLVGTRLHDGRNARCNQPEHMRAVLSAFSPGTVPEVAAPVTLYSVESKKKSKDDLGAKGVQLETFNVRVRPTDLNLGFYYIVRIFFGPDEAELDRFLA